MEAESSGHLHVVCNCLKILSNALRWSYGIILHRLDWSEQEVRRDWLYGWEEVKKATDWASTCATLSFDAGTRADEWDAGGFAQAVVSLTRARIPPWHRENILYRIESEKQRMYNVKLQQ